MISNQVISVMLVILRDSDKLDKNKPGLYIYIYVCHKLAFKLMYPRMCHVQWEEVGYVLPSCMSPEVSSTLGIKHFHKAVNIQFNNAAGRGGGRGDTHKHTPHTQKSILFVCSLQS